MNNTIGYDLRSNTLFYNTMTGVQANNYYYTGGWNYSIGYVYSLGAAMMAVLILLGLSSMFSGEYSSRMDSIILSSKYGKTKLIRAKIAASVVYITILDLIFNLLNLLGNLIIFGTHGWDAPMQCLTSYMYSPYNFTVFQYYLLQLLIHLGACIVFGLFIILVSSLCKTQVLTFFICTIVFILPFMIDKVIAIKTPLADLITRFSYTWFMQVERLFSSFKVYNILEHPVFYPVIGVVLMSLLVPFCWYSIAKSFKNHSINF
jgi:ABC-type transport system involved in multi-copper enzyme maturation permease subunit